MTEQEPTPRISFTKAELDEAIASTHRARVLRVLNINGKLIDIEVENFPEVIDEVMGRKDK